MRRRERSRLRLVLDVLPVLEHDGQNLVLRELLDERDVFLEAVDVVQRDPDGDAAQVQGADDLGDVRPGEHLLVLERPLQVDAKTDAIVVAKGFEPIARPPGLQEEARQRQSDEPLSQLVPDGVSAKPAPDAPVDGGRLDRSSGPSERATCQRS